ncbi:MAG: rhodanese-like domain-containing protein [Deltaproteobacteria bacterium]|nr:MAG: rhodanese-like domain-containing protein [Deltaproteobacteria bacterium]
MRIQVAHSMPEGYAQVRPGDVARRDDVLFVDVRPEERDLLGDIGHIHGVHHAPVPVLLDGGLGGLPPETPLVVVCNDGRESREAAIALAQKQGFTEVYHLVGGMVRWSAEGRPVARARTFK